MGDADLVKPMLEKLGTVHFGRINMKPGKPATFATLDRGLSIPSTSSSSDTSSGSSSSSSSTSLENRSSKVLFFGLPGNPVSCLVTKSIFIDPALKKLQGVFVLMCAFDSMSVYTASKRHFRLFYSSYDIVDLFILESKV